MALRFFSLTFPREGRKATLSLRKVAPRGGFFPKAMENSGIRTGRPTEIKSSLNPVQGLIQRKNYLGILDLASQKVTVVPGSVGMYSPRWSPDGRYLAALSWAAPLT